MEWHRSSILGASTNISQSLKRLYEPMKHKYNKEKEFPTKSCQTFAKNPQKNKVKHQ